MGNQYLGLSRKANIEAYILVFLIFFLTSPYFFWNWYGNLFVNILVSTIAMVLVWRNTDKLRGKQKTIFTFFVVLWIFYLFNEFSKGARLGVVAYFPYVMLGFVPFMRKEIGRVVFNRFSTVYAVLIGLSMISWILAMTGIISPIGELGMDNESLEAQRKSYLVYPLALVSTKSLDLFTRFCGFYDEPGMVGTISALILCAKRFNMKDWRCVITLLAGLLSTSMFFYGLVAVYWIAELLFVRKKIGPVLLLAVGVSIFYVATKDDDAVSYLIWDRFEWDSQKGGFAGNTREGEGTTMALNKMKATGEIWFGVKDKEAYWAEMMGTSSIYNIFAMYGLIFTVLYIAWVLYFGYYYKTNRWDYLLFCFVVVGCMYQRPGIFDLPFTFLYVCIARYGDYQISNRVAARPQKSIQGKVELFPSNNNV